MPSPSVILGIETSCDDTAAAVIVDGKLASSVVSSQQIHAIYGGVVPEVASRAHEKWLVTVVEKALADAGVSKSDLTGLAVTHGPGLIGSLMVGVSFTKALSVGLGIPFVGVNHLEGHLASLMLTDPAPPFPHLCLVVSGGHTQLMQIDGFASYRILGATRDDAAGEAFDKVGKILGLEYPAGPKIDQLAAGGNTAYHAFPRTRLKGYDYSFSGIKTSVLYYLNAFPEKERDQILTDSMADVCASFQEAVVDMLVAPVKAAIRETGIKQIGLVGGVSANSRLRARMKQLTDSVGGALFVPEMTLCMDNAAMIAAAGHVRLTQNESSPLTLTADPALKLI